MTADDPRSTSLTMLGLGQVTLLVDADHPGCFGLPDHDAGSVLVVPLFPHDAAALTAVPGAEFPLPHLQDGERCHATIAWTAVFAATGVLPDGSRGVRVWLRHLPPMLGDGAHAQAAVQAALVRLGIVAPPRQGQPRWRLQLPTGSPAAVPAGPDKPTALAHLLDGVHGRVEVLVRGDVPGVRVPGADGAPHVEIRLARTPPFTRLELGVDGLSFELHLADGDRSGYVPWPAVAAMKDAHTGAGWFWPADLPASARQHLPVGRGDLASWAQSLPLEPDTPAMDLALMLLEPWPEQEKRRALDVCLGSGSAALLVSARAAGVVIPEGLRVLPVVVVPIGLGDLDPELEAGMQGVSATMLDDLGRPARVRVPWPAVFGIGAGTAREPQPETSRIYAWRQDYPLEVTEALLAMADLADGRAPRMDPSRWAQAGDPNDATVPSYAIGTTDDGRQVIRVLQPIGPSPAGGGERPVLCLAFTLEHPGTVH